MAKRFTDTDKYKKSFIRSLPGPYKLLWDYLYLDCNHAGIWHKDFDVAQIMIGKDMPVNEEDALRLFNNGEKRIEILDGGSKWLILPFAPFQYGALNPNNRLHQSVLNILDKALPRALKGPSLGPKDKDKNKEKVKDKDKEKVISTKNAAEPADSRKLTEIQKVITVYKLACGFKKDDKEWDKNFFPSHARASKKMIDFFGDWKDAADCIQDTVEKIHAWKPDATISLEKIYSNHAAEWKKDKQEREEKDSGVLSLQSNGNR